jgi:hypothetical protein
MRADGKFVHLVQRRLETGDVLEGEVNTSEGWFDLSVNGGDFLHRYNIPVSEKEGYWFGITLSNDLLVTILPPPPVISHAGTEETGGTFAAP